MEATKSNNSVSVVIPALNEEKQLPKLLQSLVEINVAMDIVVVDGHSEDRTIQVVNEFIPKFVGDSSLQYIVSSKRSISFQRNLGAVLTKYSTLLFIDADVVMPETKQFKKMLEEFRESKAVVATPRLKSLERDFSAQFGFLVLGVFQRCMHVFKRPYFGGACLLTTAEVFKKNEGFDQEAELAEDVDYAFRAVRFGHSKILSTTVSASGRRFIKYGVFPVLFQLSKATILLALKGKLTKQDVYYPLEDR